MNRRISSKNRNDPRTTYCGYHGGDLTEDEVEFIMAVDEYKRTNRRPFPTWSEVLMVVKELGYRKQEN